MSRKGGGRGVQAGASDAGRNNGEAGFDVYECTDGTDGGGRWMNVRSSSGNADVLACAGSASGSGMRGFGRSGPVA